MEVKKIHENIANAIYNDDIELPLDNPFIDDRGWIQNLWLANCNGVSAIFSKKDTIRAQHWHMFDNHACWIAYGEIEYSWQDLETFQQTSKLNNIQIFKAGQMFFTAPKIVHQMKFLEDTMFITISRQSRDHDSHEQDVHRVSIK